jgi:hypothetical protein
MENIMDISMVDVLLHIDEDLDKSQRNSLENYMRDQQGVIGLGYQDQRPHLMVIEYNPDQTSSIQLLRSVTAKGLHAELVGL